MFEPLNLKQSGSLLQGLVKGVYLCPCLSYFSSRLISLFSLKCMLCVLGPRRLVLFTFTL